MPSEGSLRPPPSRHSEYDCKIIHLYYNFDRLSVSAKQNVKSCSDTLRKPRSAWFPFDKILFDSTTDFEAHYVLMYTVPTRYHTLMGSAH